MSLPLPAAFSSSRARSLGSRFTSMFSPLDSPFIRSRSFFSATSSSRTCFSRAVRTPLPVLASPSRPAIRFFISSRSMSQALRSRSCRCHSVCRNRMTPIIHVRCDARRLVLVPTLQGVCLDSARLPLRHGSSTSSSTRPGLPRHRALPCPLCVAHCHLSMLWIKGRPSR